MAIISFFPLFYLINNYKMLFRIYKNCQIFIIDLVSTGLFINFSILPFDKIKNNKIILFIKQITSYTGGIYYLHPEIYNIFEKYIIEFKNKTFKGCIINYLICYFVCFFGTKIFKKSKFKFLFN